MVTEMLKKENVKILSEVSDWKEAVKVSLQPLVDGGYIETKYINSIIEDTYKLGPYYVLTEDVALIHNRPDKGVIKKQIGVTVLKKPVSFVDEQHKARLLVALAASDTESHINVMMALASIFEDKSKIETIIASNSEEEIYNYFINEMEMVKSE